MQVDSASVHAAAHAPHVRDVEIIRFVHQTKLVDQRALHGDRVESGAVVDQEHLTRSLARAHLRCAEGIRAEVRRVETGVGGEKRAPAVPGEAVPAQDVTKRQ